MLVRFTRLPLRRCIHTQAGRPRSSRYLPTALGASAITAAYLAWRSLSDPIALDSATPTQCMFSSLSALVNFASHRKLPSSPEAYSNLQASLKGFCDITALRLYPRRIFCP